MGMVNFRTLRLAKRSFIVKEVQNLYFLKTKFHQTTQRQINFTFDTESIRNIAVRQITLRKIMTFYYPPPFSLHLHGFLVEKPYNSTNF